MYNYYRCGILEIKDKCVSYVTFNVCICKRDSRVPNLQSVRAQGIHVYMHIYLQIIERASGNIPKVCSWTVHGCCRHLCTNGKKNYSQTFLRVFEYGKSNRPIKEGETF